MDYQYIIITSVYSQSTGTWSKEKYISGILPSNLFKFGVLVEKK